MTREAEQARDRLAFLLFDARLAYNPDAAWQSMSETGREWWRILADIALAEVARIRADNAALTEVRDERADLDLIGLVKRADFRAMCYVCYRPIWADDADVEEVEGSLLAHVRCPRVNFEADANLADLE